MKITLGGSYFVERRGQARRATVDFLIEAENELEKALLRMTEVGSARYDVFSSGNAGVTITMPRKPKTA